jgi:hypothetical protein
MYELSVSHVLISVSFAYLFLQGTVVRHFTCHCREGQSSASFMKPNKLDRGVGFMEVIHKRYVALDAPLEAPNQVRNSTTPYMLR